MKHTEFLQLLFFSPVTSLPMKYHTTELVSHSEDFIPITDVRTQLTHGVGHDTAIAPTPSLSIATLRLDLHESTIHQHEVLGTRILLKNMSAHFTTYHKATQYTASYVIASHHSALLLNSCTTRSSAIVQSKYA